MLLVLSSFAEVCFFLLIFLILGCLFFRCCVVVLVFVTSCLGCLFLRVGFGAFILWLTLLGGRSGRANREGSIYFLVFFIIGLFGRKQALPPRARVFANGFGFEIGHGRGKKTKHVQFGRQNAIKIGVSESFPGDKKWANLIYETHFCGYPLVT